MGMKAWSNEQEKELVIIYINKTKNVEKIAKHFGKGYRSVISKLVNMGIYEKPDKNKKDSRTVKTMLRELEAYLEIEIEGFNLNKKSNLEHLVDAVIRKLER